MDPTPVGQRLRAWRIVACRREQLALQRRVVELGRDRPSDADHRRPANVFRDRCAADPDRLSDHSGARPTCILQAQNFSSLPHRQSLGGHRTSPCWFAKGGPCPVQIADNGTRFTLSTGWPPSIGIGGRFRSDWVAAFRRNQWPPWLGFRTHTGRDRCHALKQLIFWLRSAKFESGLQSTRCLNYFFSSALSARPIERSNGKFAPRRPPFI